MHAVALAVSSLLTLAAPKALPAIATVDVARVLRECEAGVLARARLAKEKARWEREAGLLLDDWGAARKELFRLDRVKHSAAWVAAERAELDARRALYARWDGQRAVFEALEARLLAPVEARVRAAIARFGVLGGFALVVDAGAVAGVVSPVDLTQAVLDEVDADVTGPGTQAPRTP